MSTVPALPLDEMPPAALKQQVADRLAEHRRRKGLSQPTLPLETDEIDNPIAAAVAARFQKATTYQDFLQAEADAARRKAEEEHRAAEAAAEMARRKAEAIAQAQRELMEELAEWNARIAEANAANPYIQHDEAIAVAPAGELVTMEEPVAAMEIMAPSETLIVKETIAPVTVEAVAEPAAEVVGAEPVVTITEEATVVALILRKPTFELPAVPAEPTTVLPANLIEFPRQLVAARKARPRLAEGPLREAVEAIHDLAQLRIFEVEPEQISTEAVVESVLPEWSSIRLDAHKAPAQHQSLSAQMSFILQPQAAPLSQRVMAACVDACCISAAFIGMVAVAAYVSPELPRGLMAGAAAGGSLFALWLMYQLFFFTFGDATPGMRYARIGLCTFSDENPTRSAMRLRILAKLLSACPAGIGFIWACLDEDGLGWHDRISRMYPRAY